MGELLRGLRETLHVSKPGLTKMPPTFLEAGSCRTALHPRPHPEGEANPVGTGWLPKVRRVVTEDPAGEGEG